MSNPPTAAAPMVDLRSDTVTRPSRAMRAAMAAAVVGDDVFGEDPTVSALEERVAALLRMEAGLYLPSGTMANEVALHVLAPPGSEVVCAEGCHLTEWEMSAMTVFSGLLPRTLPAPNGRLDPRQVAGALRAPGALRAGSGLLAIENSNNMAGGRVYDRRLLDELLQVARRAGVPAYLDGARLFNAAAALGCEVGDLSAGFDAGMVSLSKGLGAPVGSVLCGSRSFVAEARRVRRRFGGGWRQAGILAAAGLLALDEGPALLAEDHPRARRLADAAVVNDRLEVDPSAVETNIVIVGTEAPDELVEHLREHGVLALSIEEGTVRFVTHRDVDDEGIGRAVTAIGTF